MKSMTNTNTTTTSRSSPCRCRPSVPAAADVIGQVYNGRKKARGGTGANQHKQNPQNEDSALTCQAVASELGVGRAARSRDAARPAPAGCRHRVRLVDAERPVAGRERARRSAVLRRSQTKVSNVQASERFLLFRHDPARRTTFASAATGARRRAERRRRRERPYTGLSGSFSAIAVSSDACDPPLS
jgi:hypothetical protein